MILIRERYELVFLPLNIITILGTKEKFFSYTILGDKMIVKYTDKELELLARLIRAEAVGEGNLGMLMVGNVGINRVLADCLTFKDITTISQMVYQSPGGV